MKSYLLNTEINKQQEKPLLHIYTGEGKGKTSSAMGTAIRALGQNKRVTIAQFMKNLDNSGEWKFYNDNPQLHKQWHWKRFGRKEFMDPKNPLPQDYEHAEEGLKYIQQQIEKSDIIIADEINMVIAYKLLKKEQIEAFLEEALKTTHCIFTGRGMPDCLKEKAHLVSVINSVKHPYEENIPVIEGLDY